MQLFAFCSVISQWGKIKLETLYSFVPRGIFFHSCNFWNLNNCRVVKIKSAKSVKNVHFLIYESAKFSFWWKICTRIYNPTEFNCIWKKAWDIFIFLHSFYWVVRTLIENLPVSFFVTNALRVFRYKIYKICSWQE